MFGLGTTGATKNIIMFFVSLPVLILFFLHKDKIKFMIYLMVLIIPVATYSMPPGRLGLNIFDYCLIAIVVMWLPKKLLNREEMFNRTPLTIPLMLIFVAAIFSSIFARQSAISFFALGLNLKYFLFYVVFVDVIDDVRNLNIVALCFLVSLFLTALMGIYQSFFGLNVSMYKYFAANVEYHHLGILYCRVVGPFINSLVLSNYLSVGIFFIFYLSGKNKRKLVLTIAPIFIFVVYYSLFETLSRISMFASVVCLCVGVYLLTKKYILVLIIALIISIGVLFMSLGDVIKEDVSRQPVYYRFSELQLSDIGRIKLWASSIPIFFAKPFTGSGLGNSDYGVSRESIAFFHEIPSLSSYTRTFIFHFESMYFGVLYNLGIFAFVGFLWVLYIVVTLNYRLFVKTSNSYVRASCLSMFLAWMSMIINMTTNPAINSDVRVKLLFILILAITVVNAKLSTDLARKSAGSELYAEEKE